MRRADVVATIAARLASLNDRPRFGVKGYVMIRSAKIDNFRGFAELSIQGLSRINVVVGRNATGKTALLEALFLAAGGNPELALRLRGFRGMGKALSLQGPNILTDAWRDIFHDFNLAHQVKIEILGSERDSRSLLVARYQDESLTLRLGEASTGGLLNTGVAFIWTDADGRKHESKPQVTDKGLTMQRVPGRESDVLLFPAMFDLDPEEAAKRLSAIRTRGEFKFLLAAVQNVFPAVQDISNEYSAGTWIPYLTLKSSKERMPLPLYSGGANRLLAIILGIAFVPRGLVLIDEIDTGLDFLRLEASWQAVHELATKYNVQIFASTHSEECLAAMIPTVGRSPEDFALLRTTATNGGGFGIETFPGKNLQAALESGFELRS